MKSYVMVKGFRMSLLCQFVAGIVLKVCKCEMSLYTRTVLGPVSTALLKYAEH